VRNSGNTTTGKLDWVTILIYLFLVFFGGLTSMLLFYTRSMQVFLTSRKSTVCSFLWIAAALVIASVIMLLDTRLFYAFSEIFYGFTIFLLILVLVAGKEVNGQRCWFELGGLRIQPAEFAKVSTCFYLLG
jgi:rod shape determining protein RodA